MAPKKEKQKTTITFRIHPEVRDALEREAKGVGLGITAYVRHLVYTHPDRPKPKGKKD